MSNENKHCRDNAPRFWGQNTKYIENVYYSVHSIDSSILLKKQQFFSTNHLRVVCSISMVFRKRF